MRQVIEVRRRRARHCPPPIAAASVLLLCAIATAEGQTDTMSSTFFFVPAMRERERLSIFVLRLRAGIYRFSGHTLE